MGYRIVMTMAAEPGAEARLWALVSQRRIDVSAAWFKKNRHNHEITAALEVELDLKGVRRFMRQLTRHHDIRTMTLEPQHSLDLGQRPVRISNKRLTIPPKKGAVLS